MKPKLKPELKPKQPELKPKQPRHKQLESVLLIQMVA
jgi:hypothetical protein